MAFDKTPSTWLDSWSEDGTNITVPISTFPELTAAEADATTGDIRDIMFAIVEKFWVTYNARAAADRPNKVTISKTATANMIRKKLTNRYVFTIETDISTQEVRDEFSSSPSSSPSASTSSSASSSPSASTSSSPSSSVSSSPSTSPSSSASSSPSTSPSSSASSSPSSSPSAT